jgi:methionine-rich copper-binding protein CopC
MNRALLACLMIAAGATPAIAHAFLQHASPGAGDTLMGAPREVALTFSEALEPAFSGVGVSDAAGHDVEAAATVVSGASMRAALKRLAAGTYRVTWHAVSVDAHRTEGAYSFTVKP